MKPVQMQGKRSRKPTATDPPPRANRQTGPHSSGLVSLHLAEPAHREHSPSPFRRLELGDVQAYDQFAEMWANAFPDGKVEIDNVVDGGDQVVIEYTGRGTHSGTLAGPMGEITATNRPVTLKLCDVWRFQGGTAKTVATYFDSGSLMTQLGLVPEAVGATT
jgi:predicted ester cyclase